MPTVATTRILHASANTQLSGLRSSWIWPLPKLDGVVPGILASTGGPPSEGIEIGYEALSFSPSLVPVFAAQDGIVAYAGPGAEGSALSIDHADGWSTHYSELEHLLTRPTDRFRRRRKERVRAGDVIAHARRSAPRVRFGLSRVAEDGSIALDPAAWMPAWSVLPWFAEPHGASPRAPRSVRLRCPLP